MTAPTTDIRLVLAHAAQHRAQLIRVSEAATPWLAFLHEGLGSIPQWRTYPTDLALATGLNAFVYERRNHGSSDPLPAPRDLGYHAQEAEIFEELLEHLGIDRVASYGHSDGATIALLHAARHPQRVAAVVSEAGHVRSEPVARSGIVDARRQFDDGGLRDALARHHGDRTDAMFRAWSDTWLLPVFEDWDITKELDGVTAPVLVMQGEHDQYATPEHVDWIADAVGGPAQRWLVPGVGHAPHREAPNAAIARVVEFLEQYGVVGTP